MVYACRQCDPIAVPVDLRIRTAGPAQVGPIAKGLCGPGLLAHAVTAKFADHTPVHRLAGQLARSGVTVPASTPGDWLARAADLLAPLTQLMHRRLLLSRVVHGDDTGVKLRVPKADRTTAAHLWACIGDADFPYVVFDFTTGYTAAGPTRFLAGYTGYFQADALAQYDGLYGDGQATHVCCVAHARRKFVAAADAGDDRAAAAVGLFARLYAVERALPPLLPPSDDPGQRDTRRQREDDRRAIRARDAGPVWDDLANWLAVTRPGVLPKSPARDSDRVPGEPLGRAQAIPGRRFPGDRQQPVRANAPGRGPGPEQLGRARRRGRGSDGRRAVLGGRHMQAPRLRPVHVSAGCPPGPVRPGR